MMIITHNGPQNIDQVKIHFECGNSSFPRRITNAKMHGTWRRSSF